MYHGFSSAVEFGQLLPSLPSAALFGELLPSSASCFLLTEDMQLVLVLIRAGIGRRWR